MLTNQLNNEYSLPYYHIDILTSHKILIKVQPLFISLRDVILNSVTITFY